MSIVTLILLVVVILNYQSAKKVAAELASAKSNAESAEQKSKTLTDEVKTLKSLIDVSYEPIDVAKIKEEHEKDMRNYTLPASADIPDTYRVAVQSLYAKLVAKNKEHDDEKNSRLQLEADYKNLNELYKTVANKYDEERKKAIDDLAKAREEFTNTLATTGQKMSEIETTKIAIQTKAAQDVNTANETATRERTRAENAEARGVELGSKLQQLLRPIFDRPDGVVEVVNLNTRAVVVDIGYADGVETRMTFSVYDPKIAGISYDTNLYGENPVLCQSCKRNVSLHASKASIEIVRILGPHRSEARIIIEQLVNPILAGDVIHSPIWDRGQKLRIALGAGMYLPEVGNPAGDSSLGSLTDVKNMIMECGGKVDSYISDGRSDGNIKRGEIIGLDNITADTSFIVIGQVEEGSQEPEIMAAQDKMRQKAKSLAIKEISLKELKLKIGWRNPTPLRDYGTGADDYDLRLPTEGGKNRSTGVVSPLYDKQNGTHGFSNFERGKPISTGTVSGIYTNSPSIPSTGKVSDLFRRRKPNTDASLSNP
ncbi:MAG: hypothetical protein LBJ00_16025 [Planctomycetaceae bacterium]|nr:hypothetical protein [Planctomycetaceae bacterium]